MSSLFGGRYHDPQFLLGSHGKDFMRVDKVDAEQGLS